MSDRIRDYRALHGREWLPVLDLLLPGRSNTRSIAFRLEGIVKYLKYLKKLLRTRGPCGAELPARPTAALLATKPAAGASHLSARLIDLSARIRIASTAIPEPSGPRFFSFSGVGRPPGQIA